MDNKRQTETTSPINFGTASLGSGPTVVSEGPLRPVFIIYNQPGGIINLQSYTQEMKNSSGANQKVSTEVGEKKDDE